MAPYFRIDEWQASGNGSKIHFEESKISAMAWVSGMNQITPQQTQGIEHTSIQPFEAETCDMEGWNNCDINQYDPINFA